MKEREVILELMKSLKSWKDYWEEGTYEILAELMDGIEVWENSEHQLKHYTEKSRVVREQYFEMVEKLEGMGYDVEWFRS